MHRLPRRLVPVALTIATLAATSAGAQAVSTFTVGGGGAVTLSHGANLPISDAAVRALLTAHVANVLGAGAEDNYIVLVVDANDQFVTSKTSKMQIITAGEAGAGLRSFSVGDTTGGSGASVVVRSNNPDGAGSGNVMISRKISEAGDGHTSGVMGTGIAMSDVSAMGLKRYAAGELGENLLMVSVVKLK